MRHVPVDQQPREVRAALVGAVAQRAEDPPVRPAVPRHQLLGGHEMADGLAHLVRDLEVRHQAGVHAEQLERLPDGLRDRAGDPAKLEGVERVRRCRRRRGSPARRACRVPGASAASCGTGPASRARATAPAPRRDRPALPAALPVRPLRSRRAPSLCRGSTARGRSARPGAARTAISRSRSARPDRRSRRCPSCSWSAA